VRCASTAWLPARSIVPGVLQTLQLHSTLPLEQLCRAGVAAGCAHRATRTSASHTRRATAAVVAAAAAPPSSPTPLVTPPPSPATRLTVCTLEPSMLVCMLPAARPSPSPLRFACVAAGPLPREGCGCASSVLRSGASPKQIKHPPRCFYAQLRMSHFLAERLRIPLAANARKPASQAVNHAIRDHPT
jgi:hypothetical protein